MKRRIFSVLLLLTGIILPASAKSIAPEMTQTEKLNEFANIAAEVDEVTEPFVKNNYAIFTAKNDARYVGIAFDFENFKTIHSMQLRTIHDDEEEVSDSFYFYILELPDEVQELEYRLIIDGLWTVDPLNKNTVYSETSGARLSYLNASREIPFITDLSEKGNAHFVYKGKSGQKIRLGGSFTNWDSWIYELTEISSGVYELELPLPPGKYEYVFYNGMNSLVDRNNPNRCYTIDGREANYIVVE